MLLFDMTFQLTAGAVCALGAREQLVNEKTELMRTDAFRYGLLFSMLLYVPSALAFFYAWPGWNSMYLLDVESNRLWGLAFVWADGALLCGCCVLGFWATARWLRRGQGRPRPVVLGLLALWALTSALLYLLLFGRSFTVTSYAAFHAGQWPLFAFRWGAADSFFGRPIMWCLMAAGVVDIVPLYLIYRRLRRRHQVAAPDQASEIQQPSRAAVIS